MAVLEHPQQGLAYQLQISQLRRPQLRLPRKPAGGHEWIRAECTTDPL
jgi:hypothetical protein